MFYTGCHVYATGKRHSAGQGKYVKSNSLNLPIVIKYVHDRCIYNEYRAYNSY